MKSFTNIQQSQALAEILPAESADMCYGINDDTLKYNNLPWLIPYHKYTAKEFYIPCWSLAALLDIIYKLQFVWVVEIHYSDGYWVCVQLEDATIETEEYENLIDACYEIIVELHKNGLL